MTDNTFRSSETGRFVDAEFAAVNPATTQQEDNSRVRQLQDRLDAVIVLHRTHDCDTDVCLGLSDPCLRVGTCEADGDPAPCPTLIAAGGATP